MSSASLGGAPAAGRGEEILEPGPTPTGNVFDKYGSRNPIVQRVMAGFLRAIQELFDAAAPASVLDVGCGEGVLTERWAHDLGSGRVVGIDLEDAKLQREWASRSRANLEFRSAPATRLPFAASEFELVAAIEVLEHLRDPELALREMTRVAGVHLLVSVPREPLWRALNLARGRYVRDLGDTPGHRNHWSRRGFIRLIQGYGEVVEARAPLPWTMLLVRVP